ncbi:MAG TPA: choice-of-anchor J domain-containing protein [Ignavibacteria bacterium]|nr:choice-of-anchor J domain-containing protein [Ignavibacteria bacterium]
MKKKILVYSTLFFMAIGVMLGFTSLNDNPKRSNTPETSRTPVTKKIDLKNSANVENDNNGGGGNQIYGLPYYTDNFDGANDTTSLKSRGYKVYYRGTGVQGTTATWYQGTTAVFNSFNGPATGYVAANYNVVTGTNNIDSWLVLPKKTVAAADSIAFYSRSPLADTYVDSIRVMYSAAGDSVPEAAWTELGRFQVNVAGVWERKAFGAPVAGANARYAIRYCVVNGGPTGANSDFIGIDALTLETTPLANDIATTSIDSVFNYALPLANTIAPKATFTNAGTANQVNIPVTYKVTGPVNYTSNKVIASLNSGQVKQVTFDSTFVPNIEGTYNITVYSSLASDGYRGNDTLRTSFFVVQPNYGGGGPTSGGYYFANSTSAANPAPSKPTFSWVDTTGSTSLVVNSIASTPPTTGTLDDGNWALGGLGGVRKIKFFGVSYDSVYIGTNGLICFTNFVPGSSNWNPPATGLPNAGPGGGCRPGIYPAWNDLNWGNTTPAVNRLSYKVDNSKKRLIITYDNAPLYLGDATEFAKFQVLIDFQADTAGAPNSNITFSYDSSYSSINLPYLVGIQDPTGANFMQYLFITSGGGYLSAGPLFDGSAGVSVTYGPNPYALNGPGEKILTLKSNWESCPNATSSSVLLRNATSPYAIVETATAFTGGNAVHPVSFTSAANGTAYYVVVKSVNSIETWSSSTVTFNGGSANYDFTTGLNKAYGNNQKLSGGIPSIYQGDANQDGVVDQTDLVTLTYAAITSNTTSPATDFNCDNATDLTDLVLDYNNASNFIQLQRP